MFRMAGSKQRATILGHTVTAESDVIRRLQHMRSEQLRPLFVMAKDAGSSLFMLDNIQYVLLRQSDHTFLCQPGTNHRVSL